MNYSNTTIKKGDIFYVYLGTERNGHIQNGGDTGYRPCIVIANQTACNVSPVLLVVPITSSNIKKKKKLPTHMELGALLKKPSVATFEQILTVNRYQLESKITSLSEEMLITAHQKLQVALGMTVGCTTSFA